MAYHFFPMITRMRYINRWGLMRNTRLENIQEHSHQVAVLAHALAVIQNRYFGGQIDPGQVAVAALYHDASEILTGDMPTPIKYDNPDIQSAYKQVEAVAEQKLLNMLPEDLRPAYDEALTIPDSCPGQGGGQAVRLPQMCGGGQGGQQRVQKGQGTDLRRPVPKPDPRSPVLHGSLFRWV